MSATPTIASTSSEPSGPIVLQIGEKKFYTTKETISQSEVLTSIVDLRDPDPDKPYFVDADPELFEHILRYLRTGVFPIFHDVDRGHDSHLYFILLNQARFFQVERLVNWLVAKAYIDAVTVDVKHVSVTLYGDAQIAHMGELVQGAHQSMKVVDTSESRGQAFNCPKRIWQHNGYKEKCIRAKCVAATVGKYAYMMDLRILKVDCVLTDVVVHSERLLPVGEESLDPPPYHPAQ